MRHYAWMARRLWLASSVLGFMACGDGEPAQEGSAGDGGSDAAVEDSPLKITLADGALEGDLEQGVRRFLKIPFAKPPVGDLRWKAPVKNDPWPGVRHETNFAAPCPQNASSQVPERSLNEDCLYLNVWSPESASGKAPVMVWIHGGGNTSGSAGDREPVPDLSSADQPLWYSGQTFAAKQGVVVVSMNYRLGAFGFFAHPGLKAEGSSVGNQGLRDQQLAMQWVRDNIAKFGGDPANVTIFGESAGSADVCLHVVSPVSRGLFHRAISQSGGCTLRRIPSNSFKAEDAGVQMAAFAEALGCADEATALACLRAKTPAEILAVAVDPDITSAATEQDTWSFAPVMDGAGGFLPDTPAALFAAGNVAKVPYILGSNTDEGTLFLLRSSDTPKDAASYMAALSARYGDAAGQVAAVYSGEKFQGEYSDAMARVFGDSGLVCGTHDTARRAHAAGLSVYMYNFNIPWNISPLAVAALGATHAAEISHVFGHPYMADAASQGVSDAMNAFWAHFAATGDPNFAGAPAQWPKFAPSASDDDQRIQFDPAMQVLDNFRKEECALWRSILGS